MIQASDGAISSHMTRERISIDIVRFFGLNNESSYTFSAEYHNVN